MLKNIGIAGLGLIGGSLAKAIKEKTAPALGYDIRAEVMAEALKQQVIARPLTAETLPQCDLVILAMYPGDIISYARQNIKHMKKSAVLLDCAGVKSNICQCLSALAAEHSVRFVGGHPMAGVERSGYDNSFAGLFDGAAMILCEGPGTERETLGELSAFFLSLGFGQIKITSAEEHDRVIAYTSQLAHLISSAYVHSAALPQRYGFSAGSFKDLSRVAKLSPDMWAALFEENQENLLRETDIFIEKMLEYRGALAASDFKAVKALLESGNQIKRRDEAEEERARTRFDSAAPQVGDILWQPS